MQKIAFTFLSRLATSAGVLCLLGTGVVTAGHVHAEGADAGVRHECGLCAVGLAQAALGVTRTPARIIPHAAAPFAGRAHSILRRGRYSVAPSRAPPFPA